MAAKKHGKVRLTPYSTFEERVVGLDRCPYCHNERLNKTPRRKSGPAMFHCRKCSYVASFDEVYGMHRLLGQTPA